MRRVIVAQPTITTTLTRMRDKKNHHPLPKRGLGRHAHQKGALLPR
jgi:hypothetical protein